MAVLLPRRFPPSTAGTDVTLHRAEASTDGPGSGEAARPLHMSPALPRMSSATPFVTWSPAARVVVVCRYGIAGNVGKLGHAVTRVRIPPFAPCRCRPAAQDASTCVAAYSGRAVGQGRPARVIAVAVLRCCTHDRGPFTIT